MMIVNNVADDIDDDDADYDVNDDNHVNDVDDDSDDDKNDDDDVDDDNDYSIYLSMQYTHIYITCDKRKERYLPHTRTAMYMLHNGLESRRTII